MKTLSLFLLAALLPLAGPTPTHATHPAYSGHGFSRGFTGYRTFGYGVPAYSYAPSYGYVPSYYPSYAPAYSYAPTYAPAYSYAPTYAPAYSYVLPQPVLVTPAPAQAAPAQAPVAVPAAPAPLPPPMPPAPVYAPPAPTYAPPAPAVCEQELQQGYLSAPTLSYLGTLPVYERYAFLHGHYRHGFADRQFTRHFGAVPGTFRSRLRGVAPRSGNGGRR